MADILSRDISWYDYNELGYADKMRYWNDIQSVIKNESYLNEYSHFIANYIKEMAKDMDIEQIKYARFGLVATEAFMEHLKSINNPNIDETFEDVHEAI